MAVTDPRLLDTSKLTPVMEGYTRMAVVPVRDRMASGPISYTLYHFMPWALVENRDVDEMKTIRILKGCACNGNQREMPFYATEQEILSGQVIPDW